MSPVNLDVSNISPLICQESLRPDPSVCATELSGIYPVWTIRTPACWVKDMGDDSFGGHGGQVI